jgi:7-keto-8-aminopelargonate synthetase-like enzyme
MAPPCAAQALQALRVISGKEGGQTGDRKLKAIRANANFFRTELDRRGFKVLGDVDSPIIPVMLHHPFKMRDFSRRCLDQGIAVVVVGNPAVPILYERVRFCISAAHTIPLLTETADKVTKIGKELGVLYELATDKAVLEARAAKDKEYAAWLRNAPLETRAKVKAAVDWRPEPLSPAAPAEGSLLAEMQHACAKPEEPKSRGKEFRLVDPLGYAATPLKAAQAAVEECMKIYGFGACGPRGFYGGSLPHLEVEASIAKVLGAESAIMYSAGVTTASSVIPALVQQGDRVIIDSEVHLGFRTGLRLTKAEVTWVPHNDMAAVEKALAAGSADSESSNKKKASRRTFIIVEAMYQRTGCVAPIEQLVALKERYGANLVLDESLSFGALGKQGRGLCELRGIATKKVDILIGSLEVAVAGVGGFCAGRRSLIDHQRLAGAGYCYSASSPPSSCSAAKVTMDGFSSEESVGRRDKLQACAGKLHKALKACLGEGLGREMELMSSPESFVQHLRWKSQEDASEERLLRICKGVASGTDIQAQVCAPGLCGAEGSFGSRLGAPKAGPRPTLRFCASAEHSDADITAAGEALLKALRASK